MKVIRKGRQIRSGGPPATSGVFLYDALGFGDDGCPVQPWELIRSVLAYPRGQPWSQDRVRFLLGEAVGFVAPPLAGFGIFQHPRRLTGAGLVEPQTGALSVATKCSLGGAAHEAPPMPGPLSVTVAKVMPSAVRVVIPMTVRCTGSELIIGLRRPAQFALGARPRMLGDVVTGGPTAAVDQLIDSATLVALVGVVAGAAGWGGVDDQICV